MQFHFLLGGIMVDSDWQQQLDHLRQQIDELDEHLLAILRERMQIALEIAHIKQGLGLSVRQHVRAEEVRRRYAERGQGMLSEEFLHNLYALIHEETCHREEEQSS
ncbi:chorismate mutase [Alicyclobacillaceae bacterium I2511]|jgi:chorismate mutase|nr:chorismate mutase [Alicyclobacillaceae bacterium I2511]